MLSDAVRMSSGCRRVVEAMRYGLAVDVVAAPDTVDVGPGVVGRPVLYSGPEQAAIVARLNRACQSARR